MTSLNRPARSGWTVGLTVCFSLGQLLVWFETSMAATSDAPPNLVLVLADDLGYADLGCFGSEHARTPNLDRFASEGLRLTSCYAAAANCSPARTGLMTGRTPYRVGIHTAIPFGAPMHVRADEITIATLLRNAGYTTCHVGKWHLNGRFNHPAQPQPSDHGFDYWFSTQNNALPNHKDPDNFVRNGHPTGKLDGYSSTIVIDEAVDWLENKRDRSKPFFLYVCFHEPHEPIASAPEFTQRFPSDDPSHSAYYGNIAQMDDAFGRLQQAIDRAGLHDTTLVWFTSDNGPAKTSMHPHGSAGPLRAKKGEVYEGGIRVPGIVRWPGHTTAGTESDEPISGLDWLPTVCEITGISPPSDRALDGASFLPILKQEPIKRHQPLYWQYNYAASDPKVAIRDGDWKLLATLDAEAPRTADITAERMQVIKTAGLERFELYNLRIDPAESQECSKQYPEVLARMKLQLKSIFQDVQAESPQWPVWKHARYEAQRIQWPEYWLKKKNQR